MRKNMKFIKIVKQAKRGSRFASKVRKQFWLLVIAAISLILCSAYLIWVNELDSHSTYTDAVWTVLFTLIGQGEFATNPRTVSGRVIVFLISILGVALLGVVFTEIIQRIINSRLREMIGMSKCKYRDHTIICGWSERGRIILRELTGSGKNVALIANERPTNLPPDNVFFIAGSPTDQNVLVRAGIEEAKAVVLLSERSGISESESDAKSILVALAISSVNSNVYMVMELINPNNEKYARLANVNDIIYSDQIVAEMTATCAAYSGISVFFRDILCATDEGVHLCAFDVPEEFNGKTVKELFESIKNERNLPVGIIVPPPNDPTANSNLWISRVNPKDDTLIALPMKYVCIENN
jgi:voltage-gated potassium channel